jgi:cystathionine beta-lyase
LGIDVVIHSATKYLGGHSDILAGAIMASQNHIDQIFKTGINYGANLSDLTVWLLDRSIKTLALRVSQQNKNAKKIAKFLEKHPAIDKVYYPGLKSHSDYEVAKRQMKGFGGMMSFELKSTIDAATFVQKLKLIKPSMSLAGVESTILSPTQTSHALLTVEERAKQGIKDQLLRFSIGIEDVHDLIDDLTQALK